MLVATDFSAYADRALAVAVEQAAAAGAAIVLLHVDESAPPAASADDELARRAATVRGRGVPCETKRLRGRAWRVIVAEADALDCELVVMGTRGRSGLLDMIGSVAHHVLERARRPVLVVPPTPTPP